MYRELPPPTDLRDHLACLWIAAGPERAEPTPVVPDGCVDIMWIEDHLLVAGPDDAPFMTTPAERGSIVAVRFRPGRSAPVLGLPLTEIRNRRVPLELLWGPDAIELAERLAGAPTGERLRLVVHAVRARLAAGPDVDPIVAAVADDLASPEPPSVRAAADRYALSERQLRRRVTDALGYGPATFVRIMRFQRALQLLRSGRRPADVAAAAGYSDQAHLTREVRALDGRTPGEIVADPFKTGGPGPS